MTHYPNWMTNRYVLPDLIDNGGEFQGHHTNQAYYKSGVMSPEYHQVNNQSRLFHILTL